MSHEYAPPSVVVDGRTAVPIDVTSVDAQVTFNAHTRVASVTATMKFVVGKIAGSPYFDLRQSITSASLDGVNVSVGDLAHAVLGTESAAKMRVLRHNLAAGSEHTLELAYTLATPDAVLAQPLGWLTSPRGIRWDFWFSDLYHGRFLEMWFPANLIHDAFAFNLEITVLEATTTHQLVTNGVVTTLGGNHWSVVFPSTWVSNQPLLVLGPSSDFAYTTRSVAMPGGSAVTVEVSRGAGSTRDVEEVADVLEGALPDFADLAGPYLHGSRFVAHLWSIENRAMEYAGGTTSNFDSMRHEAFHSWWARGLRPLTGADGWIDEAWTTAIVAEGGLTAQAFDPDDPALLLCPLDPFFRQTVPDAYGKGARFFRGLAHDLGTTNLLGHMKALYRERAPGPISTAELEAWLIERSGRVDLADRFHRWVYGFETPSAPDAWLRDASDDTGSVPYDGKFWRSPDIWVRNRRDGGTTHQNPERGQDNWFYARVRNRGTSTLQSYVVTFTVKAFAGSQFVHPGDWAPFFGVAVGYNLAPGATAIVSARWRKADVLPTDTHGCMLAQVHTPGESTLTGAHAWESNNLAQRNLRVVDLRPDEAVNLAIFIGSWWSEAFIGQLEVLRSHPQLAVDLISQRFETLAQLVSPVAEVKDPTLKLLERTRMSTLGGPTITAEAGSIIGRVGVIADAAPTLDAGQAVTLVREGAGARVTVASGARVGWRINLPARASIAANLRVAPPPGARKGEEYDLDIVQRDRQGRIVGGFGVHVRVVDP